MTTRVDPFSSADPGLDPSAPPGAELALARVRDLQLQRRLRACQPHDEADSVSPRTVSRSGESAETRSASGGAAGPACLVTRGVWAVQIQPNLAPAEETMIEGLSVELAPERITFDIPPGGFIPVRGASLVVGVEDQRGDRCFTAARIERREELAASVRLEATLLFLDGPLSEASRTPTFDSRHYRTGLPTSVLDRWVALGVFVPRLFDRVLACPGCEAIVSVRSGCGACGSARVEKPLLIHHFACAHVSLVADFECGGRLICPKCRTRDLVVGADYEYDDGPRACLDCGWSDRDVEQVAQCVSCPLRIPLRQAIELDLIGYHVDRLDPLAFLAAR